MAKCYQTGTSMTSRYEQVKADLKANPKTWLITGVAGFIGSNLLETLLNLNQTVVGLDNFATGHQRNLDEVKSLVEGDQWQRFTFIEGDVRRLEDCQKAVSGVDYVLHQAALGSVPRSIDDPITTNQANIDGFLNMMVASKNEGVSSFTYAASSSTYGDHPALPKVEENIGGPLSPYAVTKYVNELYASVFSRCYGFNSAGLRYFNVFGPRQDPNGAYAAVIPRWTTAMIRNEEITINGDGETSRDFCFVENAIQANILAATSSFINKNEIINVACSEETSLKELFIILKESLQLEKVKYLKSPVYKDFRAGDVRHSLADIGKAKKILGYQVLFKVRDGVEKTVKWYLKKIC